MAGLLDFIAKKGTKSSRYINLVTGEEISRRQYVERRRKASGSSFITNEQLAQHNREINRAAQLARPARKRKSVAKLSEAKKKEVITKRVKESLKKETREREQKAQRQVDRRVERAKTKKIKVKKFSKRLLKPGMMGARVAFNEYEDYLELRNDAEKSKVVFAYSLGLNGVDIRTGLASTPTIFRMQTVRTVIDRDTFMSEMEAFIENKSSYFLFLSYWIHFAFAREFALKTATEHTQKTGIKHRTGRRG